MENIGLWTPDRTEFTERFRYNVTAVIPSDKDDYVVYTNTTHLVVYSEGISGYSGKLLKDQFELPLKALDWVLMNIARLPLTKDKGGYPDGRWGDDLYLGKDIDLNISYALHHRYGVYWYQLTNKAAEDYIAETSQEIDWYVPTLHDHGLLAKLIEINDLYKDGKL
jgi:hypothetical protein